MQYFPSYKLNFKFKYVNASFCGVDMHLWYVSRSSLKNDKGEGNITLTWTM